MSEFEIVVNPSQEVFEQIVHHTGETEDWGFQTADYQYWSTAFDQFWLFVVVEKGTTNLVASVSLARWEHDSESLYSIGMYYCVPKYRGTGQGRIIFNRVMDIVGDKNACLTGVVKMSEKYASVHGFDKIAPFWHLFGAIKMADLVIPEDIPQGFTIKNWDQVDFEEIMKYDRTICTRHRDRIMKNWFNLTDTFTKIIFNAENEICGYATIRIVSKNKLSPAPFYADSEEAAEALFASLLNDIPNLRNYNAIGFLYPETNENCKKLCERFSAPGTFKPARFLRVQFTKKFIAFPEQKVYSMSDCAQQFV
ncbi:unnamed protein product [Caenorhabditis bovis]|uniref:DUF1248 domain-containing protein n=1 Tax=Caenorhabditis bovis TaxID=2654633 RepID=A0A8S1EF62_9PELO|nr:unnamed protein product [Caenorhabditis bovis]